MKKIIALLLILTMSFMMVACTAPASSGDDENTSSGDTTSDDTADSESDAAYIRDKGTMVIGYTVYEPMNYTDENGDFTGFDTELATMVSEKLGVTPEFVLINWETKEVELNGKSIDCIWNGMTLDADREAAMACTDPYVKNAQVIVVRGDMEYTDTSSLIGKTVAAEIGSAGETQIKGNDKAAPEENLAQAEFVGKTAQTDCLLELKAGTVDAAVLDMTLANAMTGEGTDYADMKIVDYLGEEDYGVAFRSGSDMRDEVNAIFDEMRADGSMQTLADKYFLELSEVE